MKEVLIETIQRKNTKRNKSQEPTGLGDQSDDGFNSQGSLEVLADDLDEQQRLREVEENLLSVAAAAQDKNKDKKQKLIESQKM